MFTAFRGFLLASVVCLLTAGSLYPQANVYRDGKDGVSVSLPPGWGGIGPSRWGNQESSTIFERPGPLPGFQLYVKILSTPDEFSVDEMDKKLRRGVDEKVIQRREEGWEDYRLRNDSLERRSIGGRQALSWVAEFTNHGKNMVEYLTRVRSERTNALFFVVLPAEQVDGFKKRADPIIDTLQIP